MTPRSPARPLGPPDVRAPTSHQAAAFDRLAIEGRGVPEPALMENAGRQTALIVQHLFPEGPVAALVGSGNNGGDALVCLRSLAAWGRTVTSVVVGKRFPEDPVLHAWEVPTVHFRENDASADAAPSVLRDSAVVIDGMLGTGIRGAPRARYAAAIEEAEAAGRPIVALDTPSGVDGETGAVPGSAIRAELTIAFGWPKLGTLLHPGRTHCGRIVAVEIGFPPDPDPGWARLVTPGWASRHLPRRGAATHKNAVGSLAIVAGSAMPGAAILAARSAFRCGAGMVRVCASRDARDPILEVPEIIFVDAGDEEALRTAIGASDALAVGPGLGTDPAAARQLKVALKVRGDRPAVLDADALTLLAGDDDLELPGDGSIVVTPHPGEMARLTGRSVRDVQGDRIGAARAFAAARGAVTLLKGAPSLVADPRGGLLVSTTEETSSLAVAGMGDVLTGAIGCFLAQGAEAVPACGLALHVTGRSAAAAALGPSLMPSDVIEGIPAALADRSAPVTALPFPFVTFDQAAPR
ncbi:MAG: NAD(P)H-hydrate dehydratase [Gemmatimonadetes bacterium]|nr:NAD(P)H-hydrate dehydratase [Gemmatimonadota bacterium]MYC90626.1 NAD(P)H-hydrate dehydratase [Gemmatimonadota bacterium]MYG35122.1 NAD(P)H-hydrate dehydratase [Gemmatimonadota bacterium]MYJ17667.1 NAD(P)H-hydrate dehydratase [Gemmatimonadota bacterium]